MQVLKATQAEVVTQHNSLVKTYQEQLEAERLEKLAAQKEAIEQSGGQVIPVVDETGKITSYVNGNKQSVTPTLTSTNHKQVKVNYNVSTNHLPSTGETTSLLGLFGGVILLALSFVSRKRVK